MISRPFKRFLGVDLGGGKGKKTALAVLELGADGVVTVVDISPRTGAVPLYDTALIEAIQRRADDAVVCVDAPLTLPACLRCSIDICPGQDACVDPAVVEMRRLFGPQPDQGRDERRGKPLLTPYTQRATEVYLHRRRGVHARETLGQGMGPLTARAVHLRRALAGQFRLNENLIEVFPRATLELLGFREPYKKRVDQRVEIIAQLPNLTFGPGVWREELRKSDHLFDAVICAYTGYLWSRDGWQMPADAEASVLMNDGWIWVPPEAPEVAADPVDDAGGAPPQPSRRRQTLP